MLGLIVGPGGIIALVIAFFRDRNTARSTAAANKDAAIAARFDDASELAKYIRGEVEAEVERRLASFREELKQVKSESREMHDAVRARETQLWLWDQRGRLGDLPRLPAPILSRLGLGHLVPYTNIEDTIEVRKEPP
ncbi:hypothetical protein ACWGOE_00045 [Leucobacter chromiiresistens]